MNWFRNDPPSLWEKDKRTDRCEHVENGVLAVVAAGEFDNFGPVGVELMCQECFDRMKEEEMSRTVFCHDCKTEKPKKECCNWTWFDFYAAQGDEPLTICNDCWSKPKHVHRMHVDEENYKDANGLNDGPDVYWDEEGQEEE